MKLQKKKEHNYMSKLLLKFINTFIFTNFKKKMEKHIYFSFFYWKKQLNTIALFFFFEALFKIRPLLGFYSYIIKNKNKVKIKIRPYFMAFENRWKKSIYWISRSLKMQKEKYKFFIAIVQEIYNLSNLTLSYAFIQKTKYYKTLLMYKTSKNYIW